MTDSSILDSLNERQREVVSAPLENALVLAGAGSGKTRVLTHRIAWLCETQGFDPYRIVAVTFTNKAAREMRERVEAMLSMPARGMWLGTFHGLCFRFLRRHWQEAELPKTFQVLDSGDQRRLVKRLTTELNLDTEAYPPDASQRFINSRKENGQRAGRARDTFADDVPGSVHRIYEAYEKYCQSAGLVDFAELLLRVNEVLKKNETLRREYTERFNYILVDEFQDTNALQYEWLKLLAGAKTPMFAVGDDDQSIYGWRGARIENIQNFQKDFAGAKVYRLEQNYRSTSTILDAANALIKNNKERLEEKNLWTDRGAGELIRLLGAADERQEARLVVDEISEWLGRGRIGKEVAVLYRSNAQSRAIEEVLIARDVAYRVYGGLRFFERAVIKDALAYLKLATYPEDEQSYERIVNVPPRGIGAQTMELIRTTSRAQGCNLWEAGRQMLADQALSSRATHALSQFYELMDEMGRDVKELELHEAAQRVTNGLIQYCHGRKGEKELSNIDNLEEFVAAANEFERNWLGEEDMTPLEAFLAHAALEAGEVPAPEDESCVQLMTLHSAKGLEFPLVLMVGMEEGLLPHARSLGEAGQSAEERRLCYVGITRAQEQLVMTYAEERRFQKQFASRFVLEIPEELIEEVPLQVHAGGASMSGRDTYRYRPPGHNARGQGRAQSRTHAQTNGGDVIIGRNVEHHKFGRGIVLDCEGAGASTRVQVRFDIGTKWLVLSYANLKML